MINRNMVQHNSIKSLLVPLQKRWYIIVIFILLSSIAATRYLYVSTPMYQASCTIKTQDQEASNNNLYRDFDVFNTNTKVQSEVEVLRSNYIFEKALDKLDFNVEYYHIGEFADMEEYHSCPFKLNFTTTDSIFYDQHFDFKYLGGKNYKISYTQGNTKIIREAKLGEEVSDKGWTITINKDEQIALHQTNASISDPYRFIIYSKPALVAHLMNTDYIVRAIDKDVNIIKVYYKHPVPEKAMRLVNAVAQAYIEQGINDKKNVAGSTVDFINQQLAIVTNQLDNAKNAIKDYKVKNEIVNIPQQTDATFKTLSQLELQKVDINMQLAILENLSEYLRRNKQLNIAGPDYNTISDPLFTEGVSKLNIKLRDRETLSTKYTNEDERIVDIDKEITQLRSYLIESINNTRKKLLIKQDEIFASIDEQKATFEGVPEIESTLNEMNRNFFLYEKVYNFLIEKRTEAIITQQVNMSFNKILEEASLPRKEVFPIPEVVWGVALFIGLILGIVAAYIRHAMKSLVSNREDIEKISSIPFIGNIERFTKSGVGYNSFTSLTTRMMLTQQQSKKMLITITSSTGGEGKSFIAANIARTMAAMDKKVVLLDMNPHSPTLCNMFDVRTHEGIADVYRNTQKLQDVINITSFPNLDLINTGDEAETISHLLATQKTTDILNELKEQYDIVIVDTPEVGKYTDAIPFMKWSDMNLYVVKADSTNTNLIANAELVKEEYRLQEVYFVLNSMNEKRNHTGYLSVNSLKTRSKKIIPQITSLFAW